jgi:hypothetical protein
MVIKRGNIMKGGSCVKMLRAKEMKRGQSSNKERELCQSGQ